MSSNNNIFFVGGFLYRIIDIETENTGFDILKDNKRIISVQIGDATKQDLYWADSKDPQWTLTNAKKEIASLLSQRYIFAGYNIKRFDIPLLAQFLGIEIPDSNMLDLSQDRRIIELCKRNHSWTMDSVCMNYGLGTQPHKQKMNKRAEKYGSRQDVIEKTKVIAALNMKNKGGTFQYAYDEALRKIAGGMAIYDAYLEFVESGGQKGTFFYEYAIGDVISEYNLLKALGY